VINQKVTNKKSFGFSAQQQDLLKLLETLKADTSVNEKALKPYWIASCAELSKRFLSLTKEKCPGADLNGTILSSGNVLRKNMIDKQWYSIVLQSPLQEDLYKLHFPNALSRPAKFANSDLVVIRSRKIRIYPKSKSRMNRYLGLSRYWFNQAIAYLRKPNTKATLKELRMLQSPEQHPIWAFDCPQRIREHAFADAAQAVQIAKAKCEQTGEFQQISFRRKKNAKQRFGFDKKSLKNLFCFRKTNNRIHFLASELIEKDLEGTEISKENGRWFLILPQQRRVKVPESQRLPLVAIDPGIRTFASIYSPWMTGHFGASDFGRIHRLCKHLDMLISLTTKAKSKRRSSMRKAQRRIRWKIKDLVNDLHSKVAFFLVTRFDVILLPTFETSQMVSKLQNKTARAMLTWAHFRFKKTLKAKAEEYSALVLDVSEAYTSKTCSYCGQIHNLGSKKRMACKSCSVSTDRDSNGARGIMLRALSVSTPLHEMMKRAFVNEC